ncbi:CU044_5270 family protein [Streptomyces olivochromogenes]|uniref:CU044_5270 family protein n=1 Tax=Streptomyces olivochromogenes TaxID=1963 RepID=UPI001F30F440|nr:CU044_5270 family protein [Streptomyces olivochromogenes]MCF3135711.1 CU044_5270 family protein [Streptomyces olivochromogenes]
MDEMTMLRAWETDAQGPSDQVRAAARARLGAAMAEESRRAAPRGRELSRRLVFRATLAGLTAAAVGVAVVVANDDEGDHKPRLGAVSATEVLRKAAARSRAAGGDLPVPRDDQYFYTKTYVTRTPVKDGRTKTWTDESWMSVDGSKPSRREEHGKVHNDPPLGKHEVRWPPTVYSKLQDMPTDPDRLLAQFRLGQAGSPMADRRAFFEGCMLLMGPRVMPPRLQAAAFEALSKLPRIRLDYDDVDVAGRSAVGVSYPEASFTFLFDRGTYDYLGLRTKGSVPKKVHGEWKQTGWYYETRSLRDIQVVDRIGERD